MRMLIVMVPLLVAPLAAGQSIVVDLGGIVLSVSDSQTAQVFHIVDQLSEWDQYAHEAYGRWAARTLIFDQEDRRLLQQHAQLRRARGRGRGFEQAFLVDDPIEVAAAKAVAAGLLSSSEAQAERAILLHFAPRLAALIQQQKNRIGDFRNQLLADRQRLRPVIEKLARFAESRSTIKLPVFLVANTDESSGGGQTNDGSLVVEVPSPDPMGVLLHESLHVFLRPHQDAIRIAAESAGMSSQALNEGIAYALAPGLTDDVAKVDLLADQLARYLLRGTPASDPYVQSYMIAIVIRPVLRSSLDQGETISAFLPKAVEKWQAVSSR